MTQFEKDLLDLSEGGGLVNRTQFRHVLFAPVKWSGYDEGVFPGIRDAVDEGDREGARRSVELVSERLGVAARGLNEVREER